MSTITIIAPTSTAPTADDWRTALYNSAQAAFVAGDHVAAAKINTLIAALR